MLEKKLHDLSAVAAENSKRSKYSCYLNSLPPSFDTLQTWSTEELEQYLQGTALGEMALMDRRENLTRVRFEKSVKPYVESLLHEEEISNEGTEKLEMTWEDFLWASQCLSTRGFHMETKGDDETSCSYHGPYLLPYIDLLNHDPKRKCTTLQRVNNLESDDEPYFQMLAERDIQSGEEILHSYYSHSGENSECGSIPSAQLLQTFGFVSRHQILEATQLSFNKRKHTPLNKRDQSDNDTNAILAINEIIVSCKEVAFSKWVEKIRTQNQVADENADEDNKKYWDPTEVWDEKVDYLKNKQSFISDQLLVSRVDEIATCCVMLLLPEDAFHDLFVNDENPTLLETNKIFGNGGSNPDQDMDACEDDDVWLGTLVGMSVVEIVNRHAEKYGSQSKGSLVSKITSRIDRISAILKEGGFSTENGRKVAGLTIQIEEQRSLERLRRTALEWMRVDFGNR